MKRTLKVLAYVVSGFAVLFFVLIALLISKFPSTYQIKQSISPNTEPPHFEAQKSASPGKALPEKGPVAPTSHTEEARNNEAKELSRKALHEDFLNDRQPLASACKHLDRASESKFLSDGQDGNAKELSRKLIDPVKDPLVEAAVPTLRFILRTPEMRKLIDMVETAQAENENDFSKKASFLAQALRAGNSLISEKRELDQILMKSYHLFILTKAVGKNASLARDPATLQFCEQIEKNLNDHLQFSADTQAQELQKFLEYAELSPSEVGYDPNYRADATFRVSTTSIRLENMWIEQLFRRDANRATKQIGKSLSPPEK